MNKRFFKIIVIILIVCIIVGILILFFNDKSSTDLSEYTPQVEYIENDSINTIICLYFKDIETNSLVAEAKCINVQNLINDPYSYLINLLIKGSDNQKLESPIPEGTIVNSCCLNGNILYVDLSKEFIENAPSGIEEESIIIYSIVNTLTELNEVSCVKFLINGEENLSFSDNQISFNNCFYKND